MLALRKVYLSSVLSSNVANPISKPRYVNTQKGHLNFSIPRHQSFFKKFEATTIKKPVEKQDIVPKITPMKEYVEVEKTKTKKVVHVKPKKAEVDKVRKFYLSLGRLRKFEPPRELDRSYMRTEIPEPVALHTEIYEAPKLFMRTHHIGGFTKTLVMNDYETFNTMDVPYFTRLDNLLRKWEHDRVITSIMWESSSHNFSAGIDYQSTFGKPEEKEFLEKRFLNGYRVYTMRKPFAPVMSGLTLGNASNLALLANCSMATDSTIFTIPEPSFGYIPDSGLPFALARTGIRGLGEFLAVSGYTLRGQDLFLSRLARYYMPDARIPAAAHELANVPSHKISSILNAFISIHEPVHNYKFSLREKLSTIGPCFDKDTIQEVFQALKASGSGFGVETLKKMEEFSPLCLAVTHRLVRQALNTNIETSLRHNFIASQNIMRSSDYAEGIKARMENRKPVWKHKSVFEVTKEEVDAIFTANEFTKELQLEASSYVPLNGPVFRYIQSKSTPAPLVGGTMMAEADEERGTDEYGIDQLGLALYKKSQAAADRIYYKNNPDAFKAWLPGGEKAQIISKNKEALYYLDEKELYGEDNLIVGEEDEDATISDKQVTEFLETATSSAEPTGLLPDYDFLKTEDPPAEQILEEEEEVEEDQSSPYYEEITEETFPPQDDTVYDDEIRLGKTRKNRRGRERLWKQYFGEREESVLHDEKMYVTKIKPGDEY